MPLDIEIDAPEILHFPKKLMWTLGLFYWISYTSSGCEILYFKYWAPHHSFLHVEWMLKSILWTFCIFQGHLYGYQGSDIVNESIECSCKLYHGSFPKKKVGNNNSINPWCLMPPCCFISYCSLSQIITTFKQELNHESKQSLTRSLKSASRKAECQDFQKCHLKNAAKYFFRIL